MKRAARRRPFFQTRDGSVFLDRFQHLEDRARRANEKSLERLRQATALEGIAAHSFTFGHGALRTGLERDYTSQFNHLTFPSTISAGTRAPSAVTTSPLALARPSNCPSNRVPSLNQKTPLPLGR